MQLAIAIAAVLAVCLAAHAASSSQEKGAGAPPLPPEVKRLQSWVGTWDAEVTMMGQTVQGTETCRLACNGLWLVTEHESSFMGQPYQGKGFTGFDAAQGAFSGAWIDSTGGPMSVYRDGQFSADGKTFTAHVDGVSPDGRPARFEHLSTFPDARTRTFEIRQLDGASQELHLRIHYTKRS